MKLKKWVTIKFSLCLRAFAVKNTFRKIKSVVHFLPVIVFLVIGSCNNPSTQKNVIPLEPTQKEKLELGKPSRIIKLETSPESQLGTIWKVAMDIQNDRIFVLSDMEFFVFDANGKFINKLTKGKGPGEVYDIFNFSIDRKKKKIYVNQIMANIITIVDYNGEVQKTHQLNNFYFFEVKAIDDENFLLLNNTPSPTNPFFISNYNATNDTITGKFIPAEESPYPLFSTSLSSYFMDFKDRLFFASTNIFGLFEFKNNQFERIISYDLGDRKVPETFPEKFNQGRRMGAFADAALENGFVPYLIGAFYFRNYNVVIIKDEDFSCYAISEKNREKVYLNGPISTYFGLPALESFKNPTEINENYLVFAVNPTDFFVENPTSDKTTVEIGNQKLEVELEENPFLVIVE